MKNLFRILVVIAFILLLFIYFDTPIQENELITGSSNSGQLIPQEEKEIIESNNIFSRPKQGISTLIGKHTQEAIEQYGKPTRIEPSSFGYDWWVYNNSFSTYLLIGVQDDVVTQTFAVGSKIDTAPYQIGQDLEEIYRFTIVSSEITMFMDDNTYTFSLNEEDIHTRILVQFDDLYAMLYIDKERQTLEAVRFTEPHTLLLHKPYDILYSGSGLEISTPDSSLQAKIDSENARQVVEITNVYRFRNGLKVLESDLSLHEMARFNSEDMAKNNVVVNESFEVPKFSDMLEEYSITFNRAGGNTAAFYFDAGEAVNGWLNSKNHRDTLLGKWYTHTGVGVYSNYYTQNFIERPRNWRKYDY